MSPNDFKTARASDKSSVALVCNRPYFHDFVADATSPQSIAQIASQIVQYPNHKKEEDESVLKQLKITRVSGGITNILFRVSNIPTYGNTNEEEEKKEAVTSVLVRIFGAEGMIDRDIETAAYAALCDANIAYQYLGRFANGRIEGWLDGYVPLKTPQLSSSPDTIGLKISEQMANLHANFEVTEPLQEYFSLDKPGMWDQLFSWLEQAQTAVKQEKFKDGMEHVEHARKLFMEEEFNVEKELHWLQEEVVPKDAEVVFCHNDLLAANIMMKETENDMHIQLIDFEYGGTNYAAFDIANHFNEYAGGTEDGIPDYSLFPSHEAQLNFIETYLVHRSKFQKMKQDKDNEGLNSINEVDDKAVKSFMEEVHSFVLANHLYWGLWAVNQAAVEGCDEFNYLLYAKNRFKRYQESK